jgi:hypothetical protein
LAKHANLHFMASHANLFITANSSQHWVDHWGDKYVGQAALWRKALAELPAEVASKVAHENAERLWKLPTAR